jgi:hypothetical protein
MILPTPNLLAFFYPLSPRSLRHNSFRCKIFLPSFGRLLFSVFASCPLLSHEPRCRAPLSAFTLCDDILLDFSAQHHIVWSLTLPTLSSRYLHGLKIENGKPSGGRRHSYAPCQCSFIGHGRTVVEGDQSHSSYSRIKSHKIQKHNYKDKPRGQTCPQTKTGKESPV